MKTLLMLCVFLIPKEDLVADNWAGVAEAKISVDAKTGKLRLLPHECGPRCRGDNHGGAEPGEPLAAFPAYGIEARLRERVTPHLQWRDWWLMRVLGVPLQFVKWTDRFPGPVQPGRYFWKSPWLTK